MGLDLVTPRVNWYIRKNNSITRGHNLKIVKEKCRLNIRKQSLIYRNTGVWNSMPQSAVDAPSD